MTNIDIDLEAQRLATIEINPENFHSWLAKAQEIKEKLKIDPLHFTRSEVEQKRQNSVADRNRILLSLARETTDKIIAFRSTFRQTKSEIQKIIFDALQKV